MNRSGNRLGSRRLAASFVVTVAMVPACKEADAPPPVPTTAPNPSPVAPQARTSREPNDGSDPLLGVGTTPVAKTAPSASAKTADPDAPKLCSVTDGERPCIDRQGDICRLLPPLSKCPPTIKCNPPPPRQVPCP